MRIKSNDLIHIKKRYLKLDKAAGHNHNYGQGVLEQLD